MKLFRFGLEQLLRYHQQRRRQAEMYQQRVQQKLEAAESNATTAENRLAESSTWLNVYVGRATQASVWTNGLQHAARMGKLLESAKAEVRHVQQELLEANQHRTRVSTDAEALLALRRQQWQQHEQEATRKAQERLDELSMRKWMQAQVASSRPSSDV